MSGQGLQVEFDEFPQVDGAGQSGPILRTKGWKPGRRVWSGDWLRIDFAVHRMHGPQIERWLLFVATQTVEADADGRLDLPIWPAIIPAGAFQNVPRSPCNQTSIEHGARLIATMRREITGH